MGRFTELAVVFTSILMIVINALANILPYNNITTAQVSDSFKVFFVPAGYVFSIWGVIYLGILVYCYYQSRNNSDALTKAAPYVIIGNIANSLWIILWHWLLIPFTLPVMLILLVSLIKTYLVLHESKDTNKLFTTIPMGIYLGWISVATIANVTALLDYWNVKTLVLDGATWCAVLVLIAGVFGTIFIQRYKEITYPLVIIWAVVGIAVKFPQESLITLSVAVVVISLVLQMVLILLKRRSIKFTVKD